MMQCVKDGHEIVALANLHPPRGTEELDSFMYQSVGHDAIEAFASCMELPLYRRIISGSPVLQTMAYTQTDSDEVEDLYELLKEIKQKHPNIKAVSSGAIMSTYQKLRVEEVCSRLGLVSLAYLWEREQEGLLQEMIESNLNAIIIKVAVLGLDEKDLGKTLADVAPKMANLRKLYGVNPCGEGGEFESLTLDCPLFQNKKIQIDDYSLCIHKYAGPVTVAYWKINSVSVVQK